MPRGGARTGAGRKPGVKIGKIKPETINYFRKVTPQEKKYLDSCLTNYRKALKMKNLTEQELEAIKKAITEAGADSEQIVNEIKNDYATINKGRDGKLYAWY